MDSDDRQLWQLGAAELAHGFRAGDFTPVDALDASFARIDAIGQGLGAVVVHRSLDARAAAERSAERHRAGRALGPLDGVPVSVKDNILTADMPTTWGGRAFAGRPPVADEVAVARLRAAGAVVFAKTNVPEFTLEGYTDNALFGVTRNPWNPALTPGGSSGGAVAGLAAGLFPLAIATDGGGSIRRPASHTGVVGLKPSIGAVPRVDTLPPILFDFEVVGPLARSVEDLALLFDVLRGPDVRDRASQAPLRAPGSGRLRILFVPRFGTAPVDPEIADSVGDAARRLAALGHRVTEGALPIDLQPVGDAWPLFGQAGLAALFRADPRVRELASPRYRAMADAGEAASAAVLADALHRVAALRLQAAALFESFDAVMTPSAAALPWPADEPFPTRIDGQEVGPRGHAVFTGWVNAAGLPAIALPSRPGPRQLPIGFQLVGAAGSDLQLIEVGRQWELAEPWAGRWPAL